MTSYSAIADSEIDVDSPITESVMTRLRNNPIAISEGSSGAPKIQTAAYQASSVDQAALTATSLTKQTYTNASSNVTYTFAHGLGRVPWRVDILLECTATDGGYAVGDYLMLSGSLRNASNGQTVRMDATNVYVIIQGNLDMTSTTYTNFAPTASKWDLHVIAW